MPAESGPRELPTEGLGDIEEHVFDNYLNDIDADVLQIGHHGSKTSSGWSFITKLNPQIAIISSGYLNRFNLPAEKILKRYQNNAVKVFNTADSGALEITLDAQGSITIKQWRLDNRNLWRRH